MSSIIQWAVTLAAAALTSRRCPECGKVRIVPKAEKDVTVRCERCGAEIPPRTPKA